MIRLFICICLFVIVGCNSNERPSSVLSEDEMTSLLLEIYIAEAKVGEHAPKIGRDSAYMVFDLVKENLLDSLEIEEEVYRESFEWYYQRPDELDIIYQRIVDSLNLKLQKFGDPEASNEKL